MGVFLFPLTGGMIGSLAMGSGRRGCGRPPRPARWPAGRDGGSSAPQVAEDRAHGTAGQHDVEPAGPVGAPRGRGGLPLEPLLALPADGYLPCDLMPLGGGDGTAPRLAVVVPHYVVLPAGRDRPVDHVKPSTLTRGATDPAKPTPIHVTLRLA